MVDHVDILKDGASAVYGSDAISGWSISPGPQIPRAGIGGTYGTQIWELLQRNGRMEA